MKYFSRAFLKRVPNITHFISKDVDASYFYRPYAGQGEKMSRVMTAKARIGQHLTVIGARRSRSAGSQKFSACSRSVETMRA
jgi:hypothetical protein